jgi:hypothetical protein
MKAILRFQTNDGSDPLVGALVKITEVEGNTPLAYSVIGSNTVMRDEELRTPANGVLALEVFDPDGFRITVYGADDRTVLWSKKYRPDDEIRNVDSDELFIEEPGEEIVILKTLLSQYEIDIYEDDEDGVQVGISFLRSDGLISQNADWLSTGSAGPYLADMNLFFEDGYVQIVPRSGTPGQYVGTTTFYFRADFAEEAILTVNILPAV